MQIARLMLVDDNVDNLEILSVILSEHYQVAGYTSAEEALTALEATSPDVVLLDIGMSPVDGLQCLAAMRARPGYGAIPAIALTAYARDTERSAFLTAGFQAVVTKPIVDPQQLFETVAAVLAAAAAPRLDSAHRKTA
jgi:CheY-like chemotaxis protein